MKKIIKTFMFLMAVSILTCLLCNGKVFAAYEAGRTEPDFNPQNDHAIIVRGGTSYYYHHLADAITDLQDGDTLKLGVYGADKVWEDEETSKVSMDGRKNIVIDMDGHDITNLPLIIKNCENVTMKNGTIKYSELSGQNNTLVTIDNSTVILQSVAVKDFYNKLGSWVAAIKVTNGATLTLEGNSEIDSCSSGLKTEGNNNTVNIQSTGRFWGQEYLFWITGSNVKVNIEGGKLEGYYGIMYENGTDSQISMTDGTASSDFYLYGSHTTFNMTGGKIDSNGYGISVLGPNADIDISGNASISGGFSAISMNDKSAGYDIHIADNANIQSHTLEYYINIGYGNGAGLFLADVGTVTIDGGTIEGDFGIVARKGNVTINGGTITATGNGQSKVVPDTQETKYDSGTTVIVDTDAQVNITGGTFTANESVENALVSVTGNASNYSVSGGIYNKPFNKEFVVPEKLELNIARNDNSLWYVGEDAEEAVQEAKKDSTAVIDVIQGNLIVTDAENGLTVKNSGDGIVRANSRPVKKDEQIIISELTYILGDVDQDGYVTPADASMVLKYYVGIIEESEFTENQKLAADVDFDGYVGPSDSGLILKYYVDIIHYF